MDTVTERLSPLGWEAIERRTLIASLKSIWSVDIYKSGARAIRDNLKSSAGRELLRSLPEVFEPVAELLRTFGVYGPGSLPYAYQVVTLIRSVHRLGGERLLEASWRLRRWFFWTTYNEHFTGMTSGQLRSEFERVEELVRGNRSLDWIKRPEVTPLANLRPNAVRSRAAILVMAIAGDRDGGGDQQRRIYGAQGTNALHRLFANQSADVLANRVLSTDEELKRLRSWARDLDPELPMFTGELQVLLRRNLLDALSVQPPWSPVSLLRARAERLQCEEEDFVRGMDRLSEPGA
jgi:hypothetical protein